LIAPLNNLDLDKLSIPLSWRPTPNMRNIFISRCTDHDAGTE